MWIYTDRSNSLYYFLHPLLSWVPPEFLSIIFAITIHPPPGMGVCWVLAHAHTDQTMYNLNKVCPQCPPSLFWFASSPQPWMSFSLISLKILQHLWDPPPPLPVKLSFILAAMINLGLFSFLFTFNVCLCCRS